MASSTSCSAPQKLCQIIEAWLDRIFVFFHEVVQIEMIKKSALELWGGKLLNGAFA
jgi:hypothetical protein